MKIKDFAEKHIGVIACLSGILFGILLLRSSTFKQGPKESHREDVVRASNIVNSKELYYVKDKRVNICYAVHEFGWNSGLLTYVPCTPEVELALINRE
jgi:hypothetical protein